MTQITHDELLAKINEECSTTYEDVNGNVPMSSKALRAVVELHKPIVYAQTQLRCPICVWSDDWDAELYSYPCPTIEAIEKELK